VTVDPPEAAIRTQITLPLRFSDGYQTAARVTTFTGLVDGRENLAIGLGEPTTVPLVRPHSECLTGDVFGSQRCDCVPQLREAVERISRTSAWTPTRRTSRVPTGVHLSHANATYLSAKARRGHDGLARAIRLG
jgi:GTP cyclohydrolase II